MITVDEINEIGVCVLNKVDLDLLEKGLQTDLYDFTIELCRCNIRIIFIEHLERIVRESARKLLAEKIETLVIPHYVVIDIEKSLDEYILSKTDMMILGANSIYFSDDNTFVILKYSNLSYYGLK